MSYIRSDAWKFIDILQNCITRMADNSAKCKNWCLALVSALAAFCLGERHGSCGIVILIPIITLSVMDAFYLSLERKFRNLYAQYIRAYKQCTSVENADLAPDCTYEITLSDKNDPQSGTFASAFFSFSVFPFYALLGLCLGLILFFSMHDVIPLTIHIQQEF